MAPAAVAFAMQPPEIQFAQRLASNEKRIRDRALKKLRGFITLRTRNKEGSFSQEELLKIWKGLFYCMWMQDKPLLQEELSSNISQLIHVIENMDAQHLFIQTFWQTMNREWNGLDQLRLDKFYMLIRMMLRESFEVLKRNGWNERSSNAVMHTYLERRHVIFIGLTPNYTEPLLNLLITEIMHPDSHAPIGVKLHFIDIYLEELAKVGAKELTAGQNLKFIEPFCKIIAKTKDHLMLQAVIRGIFETIVDQSPFAIEDLMKELGTGSDVDDSSEEDKWNDEDEQIDKGKSSSRKQLLNSETHSNIIKDTDADIGPVLQFDYKAVAKTLFELGSRKNTPAFNRKRLYKVVKKFQDLAEGSFPQDDFPEDVSTDEDDDTFSRRKLKRKSGKPFDKSLLGKKDNNQTQKNDSEEKEASTEPQKKRKKQKRKSSQTAARKNENGPVGVEESKEPNQRKDYSDTKRQQKSLITEANKITSTAFSIGGFSDDSSLKSATCLVNGVEKHPKKKTASLSKVLVGTVCQNGQNNHSIEASPGYCGTEDHSSKIMKQQQKSKPEINGKVFSGEDVKLTAQKCLAESESTMFQKDKLRKKTKLGNLVRIRSSKRKIFGLKMHRKIKKVLVSIEGDEFESKKSKIKETGGIAVPLNKTKTEVRNDFVKFEKTAVPKPAFFRKAKGSITASQLCKLQPSSSKKVTFGLNKNMTAEFKKSDKSILVSPEGVCRVAFNPKQKPPQGVLKSFAGSSTETPQIKKPLVTPAKKRPTAMDFF